jgi:hypothetical protein
MKLLYATMATSAVAILSMVHSATARGGFASEYPWAPEHIQRLPPDIRKAVLRQARMCGSKAAASHYFSLSIESGGGKFISLHFENFACASRTAICNDDGCLHQVYLKSNRRHRLVFATYADDIKLTDDGAKIGLEISSRGLMRHFQWNGKRFAVSDTKGSWK